MEKVNIRCFRSHIKILGTVVSVIGSLIMTLYRGPALWASLPSTKNDGSFVHKLVWDTLQCSVISLIAETDPNAWNLRPDIELGAILYSAVGGTAAFDITVWCIGKRGPVFVAMFGPLGVVIAALRSAIFLGDTLHVGSVVGAIIIVLGFYAMIWAKSKDEENDENCTDHLPSSSSKKIPLLQAGANPGIESYHGWKLRVEFFFEVWNSVGGSSSRLFYYTNQNTLQKQLAESDPSRYTHFKFGNYIITTNTISKSPFNIKDHEIIQKFIAQLIPKFAFDDLHR